MRSFDDFIQLFEANHLNPSFLEIIIIIYNTTASVNILQILQKHMYMTVDTTKTYMLFHQQSQSALQAQNLHSYTADSLELGPANESNPNQMWIIEDKGNARYELILGYPDQVLSADGNHVLLKKGTGSRSQQWIIDASIPNRIKIRLSKEDHKYLGVSNKRIVLKENPPMELIDTWEFKPVTENPDLNRSSYIRCMRTSKLMDVPASKQKEGVHICIWDANYRFNQRWKIYRAGEVFIIKSLKTELNLDIDGEDYSDGAKIIQWHSTGGHNQFWTFQRKGDSIYRICSWYDPSLEIGHHNEKLILNKGQKYTWKIEGFFPQLD